MKTQSTHSSFRAACVAALVGAAALSVSAQSQLNPNLPGGSQLPKPATPPEGDRSVDTSPIPNRKSERFINKVSMLQTEENRLSSVASQRANNEQLRTFASQVQSANSAREQELAQLAQSRSVLLPTGRDASEAGKESEEWQKKDARDFDGDYVHRIIRVQKNAIDALEDYARDSDSDPELSAYAQKHLPSLKESLRQAEALEKQVS